MLVLASALVAACGSAVTKSTATRTPVSTARSQGQPSHGFLLLASFVCRTVSTGAPAGLQQGATPAELSARAPRSAAAAMRMAVSLDRLLIQSPNPAGLAQLVAVYRSLERLYLGAPKLSDGSATRLVGRIVDAEHRGTASAVALGIPSCAPPLPAP